MPRALTRCRGAALLLTSALLCGAAAAPRSTGASHSDAEAPWYETCLVGMEVGPTGAQFGNDPNDLGYAAQFNGRDIVRQCVAAGSEYVVIWTRATGLTDF